jgi:predicted nucleic acid-binding protein
MSAAPTRSGAAQPFHDTNIVLSLASSDEIRADIAEALIARGGHVSVQVLNEFASVATRKFGMPWTAVTDVIDTVRQVCQVHPMTLATHERARAIAQQYGLAFDDALVAAAALLAGCELLYSADLRVARRIEGLTVRNPFPPPRAPAGSARSSILRPSNE